VCILARRPRHTALNLRLWVRDLPHAFLFWHIVKCKKVMVTSNIGVTRYFHTQCILLCTGNSHEKSTFIHLGIKTGNYFLRLPLVFLFCTNLKRSKFVIVKCLVEFSCVVNRSTIFLNLRKINYSTCK